MRAVVREEEVIRDRRWLVLWTTVILTALFVSTGITRNNGWHRVGQGRNGIIPPDVDELTIIAAVVPIVGPISIVTVVVVPYS
jgi:hypothetical protein